MRMGILDSRVIVITGGSQGIGAEIARTCVSEGATVVICARNLAALELTLNELKSLSSKDHNLYTLDVSKRNQVQGFARWCSARFHRIQGLVNCAGIYGPIGKTHRLSLTKFVEAIQINFLGTVYMCHAFIPLLGSETRKKIVNFSGGGAATPFPNYSAYATSKAAIVRFTENLAAELTEESVDVNCVAPGFVITRLHQKTLEAGPEVATAAFYENTKKQMVSGGVPAEKAARLTLFLLSPESDNITGKFLSASWDPWQEKEFQQRLRMDKDLATIRRIDNKTFFKKC
jgi:NAD(P)-dependent dehydrogenase (short-subunit alcohol dehydrogenase family)